MKFRPHRGSLADAMAECVTLPASFYELDKHVQNIYGLEVLYVKSYDENEDKRIGWKETNMVIGRFEDGMEAPVGFTDEVVLND